MGMGIGKGRYLPYTSICMYMQYSTLLYSTLLWIGDDKLDRTEHEAALQNRDW